MAPAERPSAPALSGKDTSLLKKDIDMSLSVNDLIGFNQTVYDDLKTSYTNTTGKSASDFDKLLINLSQEGKLSFQDVTREVYDTLPKPLDLIGCPSITPSFSSTYLALITEMSSEERRQNAEMRALQTEEMVDKIQEQADTIRDKAIVQLVTGIVTGTLSIAQGAASIGMTVKGMASNEKLAKTTYNEALKKSGAGADVTPDAPGSASTMAKTASTVAPDKPVTSTTEAPSKASTMTKTASTVVQDKPVTSATPDISVIYKILLPSARSVRIRV